jgi:phage terminase large subunit-like protein
MQLAKERQERDLDEGKKRGLEYKPEVAQRAVDFFGGNLDEGWEGLKHWKGEWAGQVFELAEWQAEYIIKPLFGWFRKDGTRRFRFAFIEVPRKNGKSTLAAGVGLLLTLEGEPGAEIYSSATKLDQAKIVWGDAKRMVQSSSSLRGDLVVMANNIHCPQYASKFEPLGADHHTLDGLNVHGNIIDEIHAHKDRVLYEVLLTAQGARRQPLNFIITTAGVYDPTKIGWEQHDYAQKVLEGVFEDDSYFAFIANADKDDDWTDPQVWKRANPNYGVSVKADYLEDLCEKAKRSPAFVNAFLRYHLNIWTEQTDRVIDMDDWKACGDPIDEEELEGQPCYAGLDLASKIDIAALALWFPEQKKVIWRMWVPGDNVMERVSKDRVPYDAWIREGYLKDTPGNVIDYDFIRAEVNQMADKYDLLEVAYDPWGATQLAVQLEDDGVTMVECRQGYPSLSEPTKELLKMVKGREFSHGGNPVARWMAGNLAAREDPQGNLKPDKSRSAEKIDGIAAFINALSRSIRNLDEEREYGDLLIL